MNGNAQGSGGGSTTGASNGGEGGNEGSGSSKGGTGSKSGAGALTTGGEGWVVGLIAGFMVL